MDLIIQNIIGGLACFGVGAIVGYAICKIGLSSLVTDIENLKNLHLQSPITVTTPAVVATVTN